MAEDGCGIAFFFRDAVKGRFVISFPGRREGWSVICFPGRCESILGRCGKNIPVFHAPENKFNAPL
jgi:hypothetical protein